MKKFTIKVQSEAILTVLFDLYEKHQRKITSKGILISKLTNYKKLYYCFDDTDANVTWSEEAMSGVENVNLETAIIRISGQSDIRISMTDFISNDIAIVHSNGTVTLKKETYNWDAFRRVVKAIDDFDKS